MKVSITTKADTAIKAPGTEIGTLYQNSTGQLVLRVDDPNNGDYIFLYMNASGRDKFTLVDAEEDERFTYVGELVFS